ncbi:unnamed protein product, partial [Symbiodinium sp. CCMP2456]
MSERADSAERWLNVDGLVLKRVESMLNNMPAPGSEGFQDLTDFSFEAIRNGGLHTFQHLPQEVSHLRRQVEEIVDTLTTIRYGVDTEGGVRYIRTGFVFPREKQLLNLPAYVQHDTGYALSQVEQHRCMFVNGLSEAETARFDDFVMALGCLYTQTLLDGC